MKSLCLELRRLARDTEHLYLMQTLQIRAGIIPVPCVHSWCALYRNAAIFLLFLNIGAFELKILHVT